MEVLVKFCAIPFPGVDVVPEVKKRLRCAQEEKLYFQFGNSFGHLLEEKPDFRVTP